MSEKCMLKSEWKACCCNCRYHVADNHHCCTTGQKEVGKCVCSKRRGWACVAGLFMAEGRRAIHSGWSKHGMCELHTLRDLETGKDGKG